jgi:hypothetical protein
MAAPHHESLSIRHDRELLVDPGWLLFDILWRFFSQAAGRSLRYAME